MLIKLLTFAATLLFNLGSGFVCFGMLIVGLNGYSGKQAEPGLILFIVWVLITALAAAALSVLAAHLLARKKSFNEWLAAFVGVLIFAVGGAAVNFAGIVAAAFFVEASR